MIETVDLPPERQRPNAESLDSCILGPAAQEIQEAFDILLSQDSALSEILQKISSANVKMAVFGGWARDRLLEILESTEIKSRDIDFVVDTDLPIADFFPAGARVNPFGGVGISGKAMPLEAWALRNTFLFKRQECEASFAALPATADYSVNALLFFPSQCNDRSLLIDAGAGGALKTRRLDFMADVVAQPKVQAARAVILATKLGLQPSETVCDFVQDVCEEGQSSKEVHAAIAKYCPPELLPAAHRLLTQIRQGSMGGRPKTDYFFHCWGVFEGGGVRAAAHAGAFTAAKRAGVRFGRVAGTSGGSIVAAFVAAGASPSYLRRHLQDLDFLKILDKPSERDAIFEKRLPIWARILRRLTWGGPRKLADIATYGGLHNSKLLEDWIEQRLVELVRADAPLNKKPVSFAELQIPLYVVATDFSSGQPKVWSRDLTSEESVALAVRHSCTIPFFFQPVRSGSSIFLDGGAVSNLPAYVLNNQRSSADERDVLPRILAFRLIEDERGSRPVTGLLDFGKRLSAAIIDSASEIQLQLQPNVYPVMINTGSIRSTDFEGVDVANKRFLYARGVQEVRAFINKERLTALRGDATAHDFQGFDEKMLLLVRQMHSCKCSFLAMGRDTYWLDHVFPSLLRLVRSGVGVMIVVCPVRLLDLKLQSDETRRRRLLELIGAQVSISTGPTLFTGFAFDLQTNQASAILTFLPEKAQANYGYEHEKARLYTADSDPVILDILAEQLKPHTHSSIPTPLGLQYAACAEAKLIGRLARIPAYKCASIQTERIIVDRNIVVMQKRIKEYKALQIRSFASDLVGEGYEFFRLLQVQLADGKSSIVTPPVLERHSGVLVVIEGNARLHHCLTNGVEEIEVVVIDGVTDALPSDGRYSLGNLRLVSSTVSVKGNYQNYVESKYRHIERVVHETYD